nr:hypothetical transcript [Hymenolepis microstoma]
MRFTHLFRELHILLSLDLNSPRITIVRGCLHRFHVDCMYDWLEFAHMEELLFICPGRDCFNYSPIIEVGLCDDNGTMFQPVRVFDAFTFLRNFKKENFDCQQSSGSGNNLEADISTQMSNLNLSSTTGQEVSRPSELQEIPSTAEEEAEGLE